MLGFGELAEGFHIALGYEVVDRLHVALGDGLAHHFGGLGLGFGFTFAGLGVAEGGLAAALGLEDGGLFLAFGAQDGSGLVALGGEDFGALLTLGLHLLGHGLGDVVRRGEVLDLHAGDLHAPGIGGQVDDAQEALIDGVTVGEDLVEIHRAEHGTHIGEGEVGDGAVEIGHLIGGAGGIHHLDESDGVGSYLGIVAGDDVLGRNVDHLLHHVHLEADTVHHRHQQPEAGRQGARVAAEALDRVFEALGHDLDGAVDKHRREDEQDQSEKQRCTEHDFLQSRPVMGIRAGNIVGARLRRIARAGTC